MTINYDLIGRALLHPVQRGILEEVERLRHHDDRVEGGVGVSPNELAQLLGEELGTISYHVRVLAGITPHGTSKRSRFAEIPLLELSHEVPRRGAVEHYYTLTPAALTGEALAVA